MRATHTFAHLGVSKATFEEIELRLRIVGYLHTFVKHDAEVVAIDMAGLALVIDENDVPAPLSSPSETPTPETFEAGIRRLAGDDPKAQAFAERFLAAGTPEPDADIAAIAEMLWGFAGQNREGCWKKAEAAAFERAIAFIEARAPLTDAVQKIEALRRREVYADAPLVAHQTGWNAAVDAVLAVLRQT